MVHQFSDAARMSEQARSVRKVVSFSPSEWKAVDDWMYDNRVRIEADAIRRLIQIGLAGAPKPAGEQPDAKA